MAPSDATIKKASADWIKFFNWADHSTSRGISHKRHSGKMGSRKNGVVYLFSFFGGQKRKIGRRPHFSFVPLVANFPLIFTPFALKPPQIGSFEKHALARGQVAVPEKIRHTRLHGRPFEEGAVSGIEDRAGNEFIQGQQIGQ